VNVVPLVLLAGATGISLAAVVGVDESDWNEIRIRHRVGVSYSERISEDALDGALDVNDLVARGEELIGFSRQVVGDALFGHLVRSIDVHAVHGPA
jgi:hypothetical protein